MKSSTYFDILKTVFKEDAGKEIKALSEAPSKAFALNTLLGNEEDLKWSLSLSYRKSTIAELSYTYEGADIGKQKAYILGLIYPQEESAAKAIDLLPDKDYGLIVDMCAAPGGKTIDIAIKTKGKGLIIANEIDKTRAQALLSNIERLGLSDVIVTTKRTSELAETLEGKAGLVIIDAPCSGMGMARKYKEIVENLKYSDVLRLAKLQSTILDDGYKTLKSDGYLLYSTCTFSREENQDNVYALLRRHSDMELIDMRLLSFSDGSEGQFMALLHKRNDGDPRTSSLNYLKEIDDKNVCDIVDSLIDIDKYYLYKCRDRYYLSLMPLPDLGTGVLRQGIPVGAYKGKSFEMAHGFFRVYALRYHHKNILEIDDAMYDTYLRGLEIKTDRVDGIYLVTYRGLPLGYGKISKGILKNKYPKGLRINN